MQPKYGFKNNQSSLLKIKNLKLRLFEKLREQNLQKLADFDQKIKSIK